MRACVAMSSVRTRDGNASPSFLSDSKVHGQQLRRQFTLCLSASHRHPTRPRIPYHVGVLAFPNFAAERAAISSYCSIPPSSFLSCPLTKRKTVPGATPVSSPSESLLSASSSSPRTPGASLYGDCPSTTALASLVFCCVAKLYYSYSGSIPHEESIVGND